MSFVEILIAVFDPFSSAIANLSYPNERADATILDMIFWNFAAFEKSLNSPQSKQYLMLILGNASRVAKRLKTYDARK